MLVDDEEEGLLQICLLHVQDAGAEKSILTAVYLGKSF